MFPLHKNKILYLLIAVCFLSSCATTNNTLNSKNDVNACIGAVKGTDFLIVDVPAADNFISNKLIVATVKSTGSNAVDTLVNMMSLSARPAVIVTGENDDVTAATLEAAMLKLSNGTVRSRSPVCFSGAAEYEASLRAAADDAGIHFVMASAR